jgi:ribosome-interacting GTPase 1
LPANLTPDYRNAEERYKSAETVPDKLAALDEMLATIPKHKGTEKMQADIKRRIAKLRQEASKRPSVARQASLSHIEREGAGQVVMVGPPNAGKSSILKATSNTSPEIAGYPGTTRLPQPGMATFENVQIQLVDMPPFARDFLQPWMLNLVRQADGVLVVIDAGDDDLLSSIDEMLSILKDANIVLHHPLAEGVPEVFRPSVVAANKADSPDASSRIELAREMLGPGLPIMPVSVLDHESLTALEREIFYNVLGLIRIYTRVPGKKADMDEPFVVPKGTSVVEAATRIHKELAKNLRYARVWGAKVFDGQMVPRDYTMQDGDIVEFHE